MIDKEEITKIQQAVTVCLSKNVDCTSCPYVKTKMCKFNLQCDLISALNELSKLDKKSEN